MRTARFFILLSFMFCISSLNADDLIGTSLKITIRNDLGNLESGVSVSLYANKTDFQKEENPVQQGTTNEKGLVTFKNLQAKAYYVIAMKGEMNNYGGGVQTNRLDANKVNKVTIIIE